MKPAAARISPADLLAGGIATALGAFGLWGASLIARQPDVLGGPHVVPQAAAICLLAAGIGILLAALVPGKVARTTSATPLVFLIVGVGIAYVRAIDAVGYLPATLAVAPLAFMAFGGRGWTGAILPGLAVATTIYLIFFVLLGVYDPPGRYFDLHAVLGR